MRLDLIHFPKGGLILSEDKNFCHFFHSLDVGVGYLGQKRRLHLDDLTGNFEKSLGSTLSPLEVVSSARVRRFKNFLTLLMATICFGWEMRARSMIISSLSC